MNGEPISMTSNEIRKRPKIKTHFARIVVGGPVANPCYSILWYDPSVRDYYIGYSSYSLMNVYDWLRDEFEITGSPYDNEPVVHGRWISGRGSWSTENCSVCGWKIPYSEDSCWGDMNYCPNCGAKMDLEGEHGD